MLKHTNLSLDSQNGYFYHWISYSILIVINVVIGGFRWQNLKWLAYVTVQLQVSDYTQRALTTLQIN